MNKIFYILLACVFCLTGCQDELIGTWRAEKAGRIGGITLQADGTAVALDAPTFIYKTWTHTGKFLRLKGTETAQKQNIEVSEEYEILLLDKDNLKLKSGDIILAYKRENSAARKGEK